MNVIDKIKEAVIPILEDYHFILVKVENVKEYGMNIFRVIIDNPESENFYIDIDDVAKINEELLDIVNDDLPDDGYLEITSLGIERELSTDNDLKKALNKYIYVKVNKIISDNKDEFYGYLKNVNDEEIIIDAKIKNRYKQLEINRNDIKLIRLAVEFNKRGGENDK